jgi:hypothetical protein
MNLTIDNNFNHREDLEVSHSIKDSFNSNTSIQIEGVDITITITSNSMEKMTILMMIDTSSLMIKMRSKMKKLKEGQGKFITIGLIIEINNKKLVEVEVEKGDTSITTHMITEKNRISSKIIMLMKMKMSL